ncbi:Phytochrome-like protein cph1 [Aeoliella mucimassa]|uniref:Sensor protein FixL n=2 Tax=Aeoliella mucimassa TaxID=2527972 RepID=A0A518ARI3_9BACT|nr:Phytochrome-like protein cph1 [Aeoliella mucimassa]
MTEREAVFRYCRITSMVLAGSVLIAALLVLSGWWWQVDQFVRPASGMPATHPLTAISVCLVATALLLRSTSVKSSQLTSVDDFTGGVSTSLACFCVMISATNFIGWLTGWYTCPDEWLFPDISTAAGPAVCRMSAATSFMLGLLAVSVLSHALRSSSGSKIGKYGAQTVIALAVLMLLGHLMGVRALYGYFTSVYTALLVGGLGVSLWLLNEGHYWVSAMRGNRLLAVNFRYLLPIVCIAPVVAVMMSRVISWVHASLGEQAGLLGAWGLGIAMMLCFGRYIRETRRLHDVILAQQLSMQELRDESQISNERARAIFDVAVDAIVTINCQGEIELINPAAEKLFGYAPEEVRGRNIKMLMPDPYRSNHDSYLQAYLTTGERKVIGIGREAMAQRKDGSTFPIELSVSEIMLPDRVGFVGMVRDISIRKQAEEEMQYANETLTKSNSELEHFAYIASHDLQEPLRKISAYCSLLKDEKGNMLDEEGLDYLDVAMRGSERLSQLVKDLLTFSRITTRGQALEAVDSNTSVQEAVANLEMSIEESGAEIIVDRLPGVMTDASQLTQLFQNLIGNALKYRGDESPVIHISGKKVGEQCEFSVCDNGIGIDKQFHDKIFQIFQRLHNRREYSGTGIGLALCKRIVERSGGIIWVDSEPGRGSTFHFTMKATVEEGDHHEPHQFNREPRDLALA